MRAFPSLNGPRRSILLSVVMLLIALRIAAAVSSFDDSQLQSSVFGDSELGHTNTYGDAELGIMDAFTPGAAAVQLNLSNISVVKTDSPDPVNTSSNLTYRIQVNSTGNTTAFNVTVNDTYPNEVIFLTSQPAAVSGTNNTFILGNLTNGTGVLINITVLVRNITNGTVINNTVNTTFQNETSGLLSVIATQNTTVIAPFVSVINLSPSQGATFLLNDTVNITVNVTGTNLIDAVLANITLPNGTVVQVQLLNETKDLYNFTWLNLTQRGRYNITFIANDTAGNLNATTTTFFIRKAKNVLDIINDQNVLLNYTVAVGSNASGLLSLNVTPNASVQLIQIFNYSENSVNSILRLGNAINESTFPLDSNTTLDATLFNFTLINVTRTATGGDIAYKCRFFNTTTQTCIDLCPDGDPSGAPDCAAQPEGLWTPFANIIPGQNYTFIIRNATDPGFSEWNSSQRAGEINTSSTTPVDAIRSNITPPTAQYLVLGYGELQGLNQTSAVGSRLILNDTGIIGNLSWQPDTSRISNPPGDYAPFFTQQLTNLSANAQNLTVQFFTNNSAATTFIRRARATILRVNNNDAVTNDTGETFRTLTPAGTFNSVVNLSFTPTVNQLLLVLASAELRPNSTANSVSARLLVNGTAQMLVNRSSKAPADIVLFADHEFVNATANVQQNFSIQAQSVASANKSIRRARITVVPLDAAFTNASEGISETTSAVSQNKTFLFFTLPVPQDVLLLATAETNISSATNGNFLEANLFVDNVSVGNMTQGANLITDRFAFVTTNVLNLSAGAHTARITFRRSAGAAGVVGIRMARITAVPIITPLFNLSNLSVVKADSPDPVNASSNLTYRIQVNSTGNTTAFNVTVNDTYPTQVIFLTAQPAPLSGTNNTFILGNLTNGTGVLINITVLVLNITNGTVINNTVNVTFQNETSAQNSIIARANTTVLNPPLFNVSNISVVKTDSPDPVNASSNLSYTINVNSTGNGTAYNVTVNDTYPNEVIFLTAQPTPATGTNNTWLFNLTPGTNISINITVLVRNITNGTVINNTVNTTFQNETSALLNVSARANTTVLNPPLFNLSNLSVIKTDSPDPVSVSTNLTYRIQVNSTGNGTAYNVTVNDTYPNEVIFLTAQPAPISGTNNTFILGNLTPGTNISINITVLVRNITNGTVINNTANATFQNETSALLSVIAIQNTTVLNPPVFNLSNLSVIKTDSPDPVNASSNLTYVINVTSTGNTTAFNVTVNDTYPNEVIFLTSQPVAVTGTNNTFIAGNLTAGSMFLINITVLVRNITNGTVINNSVNSTFQNETSGLLSVIATQNTTVLNPPLFNLSNISVIKTDSPDPVNASSSLSYVINVTSTGNTTAFNVTVNDTYPAQVIFLTAVPAPVSGTNNTFILGNLTPGTNISINITVLVLNVTNGTVINNTVNTTFQNETGAQLSVIARANTTVLNPPLFNVSNISVVKTDSPDPVNASANLSYQINVSSTGNGTAYNVTVNDTYPAQVIFLTAVPAPLSGTNNTFILGNLTPGTNISINITVLVRNITNGTVINNTVNTTFQNETSALLSVIATQNTTVLNPPLFNVSNISVVKTDSPDPVSVSTNLTYRIQVNSTGNGTAYNVTVNDTYPNEVIFLIAQPTPASGTNNTWLFNLTPGTNILINVTTLVRNITNGTVINNTANVTFQNETSALLSVIATQNTTVLNPPVFNLSNISVIKTDSPDPVNTSSNLTYTINVTSNGTAYNVTVNDTYPTQVIFLTAQPAPLSGTNNTFILGNLTSSTTILINITVLVLNVSNNTVINNTVNVTFQNETSALLSRIANASTTVQNITITPIFNLSNISVIKTDSPDPVNASSSLSYVINVTSTGNTTAFNVTVNDTYPNEVIFLTSQPVAVTGTNNTFILGNLTSGTNILINITVLVRNISNGTVINNTVNTTFQNETSATLSRIATQNTTVLNPPVFNLSNISVIKTDSPDPVNVSSNLSYTINVSSTGNGTAYNVTVNDTYPTQVIFLTAQPAPLSGTNNTFILGNLTSGTNISINITVLVRNASNGTIITNNVNATFQNETSAALSRTAAQATTVINPVILNMSNLSVVKTDSPDPVFVNSLLNYTITVTSIGDGTSFNVTLNDTYPNEVIFISAQPAPLAGTNNTFILGNLTPGTTIVVNITVSVNNITNGTVINNTANATFQNGTSDVMSIVARQNTTVIQPVPLFNLSNISVTKSDSPDPVENGTQLNYTITVTSTGNGTAFNVTVNDTYPPQVIFLTAQPAPVSGTNNTFILGNLTTGTVVVLNITVNVTQVANGTVINNTVNVTFQNESSGSFSAVANASTTVQNTTPAPTPPTPSPVSSGGSGGAGGGVRRNISAPQQSSLCIESWTCEAWSACADNKQVRTCTDQSTCGTTRLTPATAQPCTVAAPEHEAPAAEQRNPLPTAQAVTEHALPRAPMHMPSVPIAWILAGMLAAALVSILASSRGRRALYSTVMVVRSGTARAEQEASGMLQDMTRLERAGFAIAHHTLRDEREKLHTLTTRLAQGRKDLLDDIARLEHHGFRAGRHALHAALERVHALSSAALAEKNALSEHIARLEHQGITLEHGAVRAALRRIHALVGQAGAEKDALHDYIKQLKLRGHGLEHRLAQAALTRAHALVAEATAEKEALLDRVWRLEHAGSDMRERLEHAGSDMSRRLEHAGTAIEQRTASAVLERIHALITLGAQEADSLRKEIRHLERKGHAIEQHTVQAAHDRIHALLTRAEGEKDTLLSRIRHVERQGATLEHTTVHAVLTRVNALITEAITEKNAFLRRIRRLEHTGIAAERRAIDAIRERITALIAHGAQEADAFHREIRHLERTGVAIERDAAQAVRDRIHALLTQAGSEQDTLRSRIRRVERNGRAIEHGLVQAVHDRVHALITQAIAEKNAFLRRITRLEHAGSDMSRRLEHAGTAIEHHAVQAILERIHTLIAHGTQEADTLRKEIRLLERTGTAIEHGLVQAAHDRIHALLTQAGGEKDTLLSTIRHLERNGRAIEQHTVQAVHDRVHALITQAGGEKNALLTRITRLEHAGTAIEHHAVRAILERIHALIAQAITEKHALLEHITRLERQGIAFERRTIQTVHNRIQALVTKAMHENDTLAQHAHGLERDGSRAEMRIAHAAQERIRAIITHTLREKDALLDSIDSIEQHGVALEQRAVQAVRRRVHQLVIQTLGEKDALLRDIRHLERQGTAVERSAVQATHDRIHALIANALNEKDAFVASITHLERQGVALEQQAIRTACEHIQTIIAKAGEEKNALRAHIARLEHQGITLERHAVETMLARIDAIITSALDEHGALFENLKQLERRGIAAERNAVQTAIQRIYLLLGRVRTENDELLTQLGQLGRAKITAGRHAAQETLEHAHHRIKQQIKDIEQRERPDAAKKPARAGASADPSTKSTLPAAHRPAKPKKTIAHDIARLKRAGFAVKGVMHMPAPRPAHAHAAARQPAAAAPAHAHAAAKQPPAAVPAPAKQTLDKAKTLNQVIARLKALPPELRSTSLDGRSWKGLQRLTERFITAPAHTHVRKHVLARLKDVYRVHREARPRRSRTKHPHRQHILAQLKEVYHGQNHRHRGH